MRRRSIERTKPPTYLFSNSQFQRARRQKSTEAPILSRRARLPNLQIVHRHRPFPSSAAPSRFVCASVRRCLGPLANTRKRKKALHVTIFCQPQCLLGFFRPQRPCPAVNASSYLAIRSRHSTQNHANLLITRDSRGESPCDLSDSAARRVAGIGDPPAANGQRDTHSPNLLGRCRLHVAL